MKYFINHPRLLPSGKRADYWGCRITTENTAEEQALRQLYPKLRKAPKGRKTEAETEAWLRRIREEVERRAHLIAMGLPVGDTKPIAERIAEYIAWGRSRGGKKGLAWGEGHAEHQESYLRFWVQELSLRTLSDIQQGAFGIVVTRLAKSFAPNTVNNKAFALSGLCTWAKDCGYIPSSPISFSALDDTPVNPRGAFSLDELRTLFAGAPWERALVYRTAYFLRFRRNECDSLKVVSILWAEGLMDLDFRAAKDRKRALKPIPPKLLADLWAHCMGKAPEDKLFDWSKKNAADNLHRDMEKLGIPLYHNGERRDFHSLGHSTATSMDRHKVSPGLAAKFMRHKDWAQTQEYINHEVEAERVVSLALEEEMEHTGDTLEERMSLKHEGVGSYTEVTGGPSPSAASSTSTSRFKKFAKFPRNPRLERKAPAVTWETAEKILAQCAHTLRTQDGMRDLQTFLKLSAAQRADLLALLQRKSGSA